MRKFSVADAFTTIGAISGIIAIYFLLTMGGDITIGTSFIILALIMDGCDGAAARKFGTKHDMGRHLDSIADAISFCLAPGVLVMVVFFTGTFTEVMSLLAVVVTVLIVLLGWVRLFRFTVEGYKLKSFSGLPTPANAFLVVIICHILAEQWYVSLPFLLMGAILQVTPLPYPKVRGKVAIVLAVAIGLSFVIMLTPRLTATSDETAATYNVVSFLGLAIIVAYVLGGPLYEKRHSRGSAGG